jgi:hypothetical protein
LARVIVVVIAAANQAESRDPDASHGGSSDEATPRDAARAGSAEPVVILSHSFYSSFADQGYNPAG